MNTKHRIQKQTPWLVPLLAILVTWGTVGLTGQDFPRRDGAFLPLETQLIENQWNWSGQLSPWFIEGATADAFEATITFGEPTADVTITFFNATDTIVGRATTDTLTNKTITSPVFTGSTTGTYTLAGTPTVTAPTITNPIIQTAMIAGGAALTITAAAHAGRTMAFDTASGTTFTLPAATGTGNIYRFLVTVSETTNQHRIDVVGNDSMLGNGSAPDTDASDVWVHFAAAADTDRIDMTQETGFGAIGTSILLIDMLTDEWFVEMYGDGDITVTTPFATGAVS